MRRWRRPSPVPLLAMAIAALAMPLDAQKPSRDDVVKRTLAYVEAYGPQLETIVAEEHYTQRVESAPGTAVAPSLGPARRVIRSDFLLTRLPDGETWVAFRDAFEVDGMPLRDREDRLVALLSKGDTEAWRRAAAIADESARFNVGSHFIVRNVNVPTFVIQLLHGRHRDRFRLARAGTAEKGSGSSPAQDGRGAREGWWTLEYRERDRPTLVRQDSGADQPLRATIDVDPHTGEVWATRLTWERGPGGHISVTFDRVPGVGVLVPVRMTEQYGDARTTIFGEAVYSNFRRFQTSVRVVRPD